MNRTTVRVGALTYDLAQGQDPAALGHKAVAAARSGGGLLTFVVVGDRTVSALVTPGVLVVLEEYEVVDDPRETGDLTTPFELDLDDFDM